MSYFPFPCQFPRTDDAQVSGDPEDGGPSQYESALYYYGTGPDPAPLVYRSDSAETPFERPTGMEAYPVEKELHGVFNHPIVDLWNNKGLANKVRDLITSDHPNVHWTSIDGVRFGTRQPDGTLKMTGPVVWIAVKPGSTTFQAAKLMGDTVVAMLRSNEDLADVKVEVRESFTQNAAALFAPNNDDAAAIIRGPLSTGLGVSIATLEGNNQQQGTGTIFGVVNGKAVMLTCHHVACHMDQDAATDTLDYTFRGASMPPQAVYCQGERAFAKHLEAVQARIGEQVIMREFYEGKIRRFQERPDAAVDLQEANRDLDKTKDRIAKMETAFHEIKRDFKSPSQREIGHLVRSPPLQLGVGPYQITEDWALVELNKEMVQNFGGNFIDLGKSYLVLFLWSSALTVQRNRSRYCALRPHQDDVPDPGRPDILRIPRDPSSLGIQRSAHGGIESSRARGPRRQPRQDGPQAG